MVRSNAPGAILVFSVKLLPTLYSDELTVVSLCFTVFELTSMCFA